MGTRPETDARFLIRVARATSLGEGGEGVRAVLRAAAARAGLSTRELGAAVRIALPTVSAVCGELRKAGLIGPKGQGARLTEAGRAFVSETLGIVTPDDEEILRRSGEIVAAFEPWAAERPRADFALDQSKALPESVVRRVLRACVDDGVEGRSICLLGDDDLSSVAIALAHRIVTGGRWTIRRLCVVDVDARILGLIARAAKELGVGIETVEADLKHPTPAELHGAFDVVLTDPPYTVPGAALFLSRAAELLEPGPGHRCYLSFGHKPPDTTLELMGVLGELGLVPVEIRPAFTAYEGASIIGGVSQLMSLRTTHQTRPMISGTFDGPLYTAEV